MISKSEHIDENIKNEQNAEVAKLRNDDTPTINFLGLYFDQLTPVPGTTIDVDWYEEVNLSTVHITTEFLSEGFSNVDIFHAEAAFSTPDSWYDETISISNVFNTIFDRIYF